jgi:hypothetical protein
VYLASFSHKTGLVEKAIKFCILQTILPRHVTICTVQRLICWIHRPSPNPTHISWVSVRSWTSARFQFSLNLRIMHEKSIKVDIPPQPKIHSAPENSPASSPLTVARNFPDDYQPPHFILFGSQPLKRPAKLSTVPKRVYAAPFQFIPRPTDSSLPSSSV